LSEDQVSEKEQLSRLFELQQLDTRIGNLERELRALDDGTALRAEIAELNAGLAGTSDNFKQLDAEYHDLNLKLKGAEEKIQKNKGRLFSGTIGNPKELQDLNQEIKVLTARKGDLEDQVLMMMEDVEARRAILKEKRAAIDARQQDLAAVERTYAEEVQRIDAEIAVLRSQRQPFVNSIDETLLDIYDRIRARSANLAVVKLEKERCPGCSIHLTSFLLNKLKESTDIVRCESCGRMIYWKGE